MDDYSVPSVSQPDSPAGLDIRVTALEAVAHTPVQFVECSACHAVVFGESWALHRRWHDSATPSATRPPTRPLERGGG